jgi:hypothetical protein
VDSDGDGIVDGLDNCPTTRNADQNTILCSSTTYEPLPSCQASLLLARSDELDRPVLIIEITSGPDTEGAEQPECGEDSPVMGEPPNWQEVWRDDRIYLLADESALTVAHELEIPGVDVDDDVEQGELGTAEITALLERALDGPAAAEMALAVTEAAADRLPSAIWDRIVQLNPALAEATLGTDQVVIEDDDS